MNSRNGKETVTSADVTSAMATSVGAEDVESKLHELQVDEGSETPSNSKTPDKKLLSCKELVKLHLELLEKENTAKIKDGHERKKWDRPLEGLVVVERHKAMYGFREWVLRSPGGCDTPLPINNIHKRDSVKVKVGNTLSTAVVQFKNEFQLTLVMKKNKVLHKIVDVH